MDKELKLYYSIGEVAEMFDLPESLLRYWEKMFPESITPNKAGRGIRQYRKEDIENIRIIHHLVKEKGMTLAGTRQALKKNKTGTMQSAEVVNRLRAIREELVKMKRELDYVV
ncbi:MAG: MerR family transcriptional regulator [Bacteroidaceae bacterium]|nr:MerR family transcriptional regulator [Bacteroidaceae bacterium]